MDLVNDEFRVGLASVLRVGKTLELRDPYTSSRYVLLDSVKAAVEPTHPLYVPRRVASCLYLEFDPPLLIPGSIVLWVTMPYEVIVKAGRNVLATLTPFRVKYTVIGTPYEGEVCRWFRSEVVADPNTWSGVEALGKVSVSGVDAPETVKGVYVRVSSLKLYIGRGWRIFYEEMVGGPKNGVVYAVGLGKPPFEGLKEVKVSVEGNHTYRYFMEFREGP